MAVGSKSAAGNTYEEARKQRLEENKKRFKDLGIADISKSLSNSPTAKSKQRQPKPKPNSEEIQPRRSSRPRTPVASYVDDFQADIDLTRKRRRSSSSQLNPDYLAVPEEEAIIATNKERELTLEAAQRFEKTLPSCYPTFVKSMVRSHVYSCFWMGVPSRFCETSLPKRDRELILEDESGSTHKTTYLAGKAGLSGGWKAYALKHKLKCGDALVFQLVEPERFKIYTIRKISVSGEEPNADAADSKISTDANNAQATETEVGQNSRKRQKVEEDKKDVENDKATDGEEGQPKARRGTGRRTAVKNQMKENGLALKSHNDEQSLATQEQGKKNDEKDEGAAGDGEQRAEAGRRNSGRRSKVVVAPAANESKETVLAVQAENEKQGLAPEELGGKLEAGEDEKTKITEEAVGGNGWKKKLRKKAAPRLFRRKVIQVGSA